MADLSGQIVVPAGVTTKLSAGLNANINPHTLVQQLIMQNTGVNPCRVGDQTVSATRGLFIMQYGDVNAACQIGYTTMLDDWYLFSPLGTTIDFMYIK